jgi:glutathione synthase
MASTRTLAFVMDPIEAIDIEADTTFVLMLEAQRRGHRVLYVEPGSLGVGDGGRPVARARDATLRREAGRHVDLGEPRSLGLEKLYALHCADLMPATRVTSSIPQLVDFMAKLGGEMIVKPLEGRGGEGIFHVRNDDRNLFSILEQSTRFETRRVMAQQYIPEVRTGDKRVLLVDGRPIGAVLRVPAERETRANFHVGGKAASAELDAHDERIIERLAPLLQRDGLFFVGIDVIGGLLTEVNVTSPTGVQEINALEDRCLEAEILDGVEQQLERRRRS